MCSSDLSLLQMIFKTSIVDLIISLSNQKQYHIKLNLSFNLPGKIPIYDASKIEITGIAIESANPLVLELIPFKEIHSKISKNNVEILVTRFIA